MLDISIVVISYNTREMTLECIRSIYEQTDGVSYEVIVVDNRSGDGSAQAVAEHFPDVILTKSIDNLGFAKANNYAAQKANGRYLLLLNPDTIILDGAIQKLYQFATSSPRNRIYGGKTLFADLTLNPSSCWRKQTLWSLVCYSLGLTSLFRNNCLFDPESYGTWKRDTVREVDIVTGCFLLIEKSFWDLIKGFDPDFFMYGEDADLCIRAAQNGARPIITPDATIVHYGGASEKVRADKMIRLFRAKEALLIRHWQPLKRQVGLLMFALGVRLRMWASWILKLVSEQRFGSNADTWREIWKRRKEWHNV